MNKSIIKSIFIGTALSLCACTANFEDINTKPYEVTDGDMEADDYMLRAPLVEMQGYVIPNEVNLNQFNNCLLAGSFGGYFADSNDGFKQKYSTYNPEEHWVQVPFNDIIPKIYQNFMKLQNATVPNDMLTSVAKITKVIALLPVTDTYGPIPYTQIGADAKLTAPYDSEETIYKTMFEELNEAINYLTEFQTENFSPLADKVYGGVTVNWIRLANSLKLRLAIRISNVEPDLAKEMAESAVNHEVGVFTSNKDNAEFTTTRNPYKVVMYEYNGGDSRISADITTYMNGFNDPRREKYFTESIFTGNDEKGNPIINGFAGLRNGVIVPKGDYRLYSNMVVKDTDKLLWMNAAEVAFLRSEGALKGWNMGGSAESFYKQGVELSFEQWGAGSADAYLADSNSTPVIYKDPQGFFSTKTAASKVTIKWNDSDDPELKLEKIITQKWIANFPLGHEAWAEFRRTGYPKLMSVVDNRSAGVVSSTRMARRLMYPQSEYKENAINVDAAVNSLLIGQDNMATDLWWAKKN